MKCKARTRRGTPCKNKATEGAVCHVHAFYGTTEEKN
jgi:hypothetical protein